jgi:Zn-dependent peptidase ImmA (M78 family)
MAVQEAPTTFAEPEALGASRSAIEEFAEKVRRVAGFEVGDDVLGLVPRFGGRIRFIKEAELLTMPESIFVYGKHDFEIILSEYMGISRPQFTVAHDLAHYFLHSHQGKQPLRAMRLSARPMPRYEWEAHWFAAALLMPKEEFLRQAEFLEGSLPGLASYFDVSTSIAGMRMESLAP